MKCAARDVNVFFFLKNDPFVIKKATKKIQNETIVFKNDRFLKSFFFINGRF